MRALECDGFAEESRELPPSAQASSHTALESDIDYLARRARHERELAAQATSPKAAMAHMYLAAAYASRIAELRRVPDTFESLLAQMP
jgi:hypothetical protein